MGNSLIKSIGIKHNKVFITSSPSNIVPKKYIREESKYLSNILKNDGKKILIKKILKLYWSGEFKQTGSPNNYSKTIDLFYLKTDKKHEYEDIEDKLYEVYLNYINRYKSCDYIIKRYYFNDYVLIIKKSALLTKFIKYATIFDSKEDAELFISKYHATKFEIINKEDIYVD